MKLLSRFFAAGAFVICLGANAAHPDSVKSREPVILGFYRAIGDALRNGPVTILALGASLATGIMTTNPSRALSEDLWRKSVLPMAGTFLGALLLGNHYLPRAD